MKRALLAVCLCAVAARAHTRSASYAVWTVRPDGATVTVKVALYDLARRAEPPADAYLVARVTMWGGDEPCAPVAGSLRPGAVEPGMLARAWDVACGPGPRAVGSTLFREELPSHLHFVRVVEEGRETERVLTAASPRAALDAAPPGAAGFVRLGVEHILGGLDHLVFLVVLVAAARRLRDAALAATGFTLGHSASLALAALGIARVDAVAVEALVGLSIVVVGVENVTDGGRADPWPGRVLAVLVAAAAVGLGRPFAFGGAALFVACYFPLSATSPLPGRSRLLVAGVFGLVHGFAFAGGLTQLGLARDRLVPALCGFNAGVELGQLAVLAVVWPLVRRAPCPVLRAASAAAVAAGSYWFVSRAIGG